MVVEQECSFLHRQAILVEVYKSASWKAPAKGVRYDLRLIKDREYLLENADWSGSYLYAK
jgi:hypothetical protein